MKASACLKSMRLRTLPLSLSGSVMGTFAAAAAGEHVGCLQAGLIYLTTALLQVLSNLSNELGDTLHGTDTADRAGIHYSLQDGDMSMAEMKKLIAAVAVCCCIAGAGMIWACFGTLLAPLPLAFLALGAAAIWAAMHYTLGSRPYGYRGHGDLFVFIFFGLVSCCGACCLLARGAGLLAVLRASLLPACGIGCFSIGVLNTNNIRDAATDAPNRVTVAIKLGGRGARVYQTVLVCLGWVLLSVHMTLVACADGRFVWWRWLYLVTLPLFVLHLRGVWTRSGKALDPMLPLLVMSTFALSLLYGVGLL